MDILQIRDELIRLGDINLLDLTENDAKRLIQHISKVVEDFKLELKNINDSQPLIDIIEYDKQDYDMSIELMFLVYQQLLKVTPNRKILLDFVGYLDLVSGPDWEEELESMRDFVDEDKVSEAIEIALKVDYHKQFSQARFPTYPIVSMKKRKTNEKALLSHIDSGAPIPRVSRVLARTILAQSTRASLLALISSSSALTTGTNL